MELTDGVILLRPFQLADASAHLEGEDDEQVKWLSGGKSTLEGVQKWIQKNKQYWENDGPVYTFAIVDRTNNRLIGMVEANSKYQEVEGLQEGDANISYGLYPPARGKGYASRSVNLMTEFLKNKGVKRALIGVSPQNENSLQVPMRCGFKEAGVITGKNSEKLTVFIKDLH